MVAQAAEKGAMKGASVVAALKAPPEKPREGRGPPPQDNSLMLEIDEMVDKFRDDSNKMWTSFALTTTSPSTRCLTVTYIMVGVVNSDALAFIDNFCKF